MRQVGYLPEGNSIFCAFGLRLVSNSVQQMLTKIYSNVSELRDNRRSKTYTLVLGVNKFIPIFSAFIARCG